MVMNGRKSTARCVEADWSPNIENERSLTCTGNRSFLHARLFRVGCYQQFDHVYQLGFGPHVCALILSALPYPFFAPAAAKSDLAQGVACKLNPCSI